MKTKIIYQCEYCWSEYSYAKEAYKCEAECLKLTDKEYEEYVDLLNQVKIARYIVSRTKNDQNEKLYYDCTKELIEFEEKHHITCVR